MHSCRPLRSWFCLFVLLAFFLPVGDVQAEEYRLHSQRSEGELWQATISLEVGGELIVNLDGKEKRLPLRIDAELKHHDRLLSISHGEKAERTSVRHYDSIEATLDIDSHKVEPKLREDRRVFTNEVQDGHATLTSPQGSLTRDELDLIQIPGDSLVIDLLLPENTPLAVDSSWAHSTETMALLLGLDAVGNTDTKSELYEVSEKLAKVKLSGTVHGAVDGIATEIKLDARYYVDLRKNRIVGIEMHWDEKRAVGHTSPGVDVTAKLKMRLSPLKSSKFIGEKALSAVSQSTDEPPQQLLFKSDLANFRFEHGRQWHVTGESKQSVIMRLVDQGELVAQCNIAPQTEMKAGHRITLTKFKLDVEKALGKNFGRFLTAKEYTDAAGHVVHRVEVEGMASKLPVQWVYYMISHKSGRRVSLVFTMESPLVDRFAKRDKSIVSSLELLEAVVKNDAKPTQAESKATAGSSSDEQEKSAKKASPSVLSAKKNDTDDSSSR